VSEITIPGFELERTLGAGGFGTVWLAHQPSVDRPVAVKIGHRALQDPVARSRFERECQALGRLSGRSDIVDVHVAGALPDGRPYLVMEYVDGGTLWDRIERGPLSAAEIATLGDQICAALDHAHQADILHRDIKPENIFLRADGSIVLGDFGIAAAQTTAVTRSAGLTATIPYTAPEVLEGQRATVASDLYGVGATVLAAATRSVPFATDSDTGMTYLLSRVLEGDVPDLRTEGYPGELARVVEWLMATDPAHRPASATEAAASFGAIEGPGTGWPAPVPDSQTVVVAPINAVASPAPLVPAAPIPLAQATPDRGGLGGSALILLGALTGVVLLAVGLGLTTLTGDAGDDQSAAADGIEIAAPSSSDSSSGPGSTGAPGGTTPTTSTSSTTTTGAEPAPSTVTVNGDDLPAGIDDLPLLAPIDIPLSPADVGLPDATSAEFVRTEEDMGMCNTPIDLSRTTEVRNLLINDFTANDQVAQQAIQFEDEASAETFISAVVASLTCRSWDEETVDGSQRYTVVPVEIVPRRQFGDDTKAWESTITFENGFVVSQRSYMVRRHDRIIGLSVVSDDAGKIELAPTLMALMVDRLGYDV